MTSQITIVETEEPEEPRLPEQFIRQVEDHSLPAQQVLTDQQEDRAPEHPPVVFVP